MATKIGPLNQHEVLHNHYGPHDCCLCTAEARIQQYKNTLRNFCTLLKEQKNLDPEIVKLVDEQLWNIV